jgi:Trk K+ transport system NAD-binding subunit
MEALALPTRIRVQAVEKDCISERSHGGRHYPRGEDHHSPGESVIEPDDRIIIFATREAIPASRKFWR